MTRFETTGRSRWRRVLVFSTALLAVLGGASPGGGYLLIYSIRESFHPQFALHIGGWDPAVWPPGATLSVALAEDGWDNSTLDIRSVEDAKRGLDHALSLWSAVETADIRWKVVDRVAPWWELHGYDMVVRSGDCGTTGCAAVRRSGFPQKITSCGVNLHVSPWEYRSFLEILMHELGHCLGLDHSESHPDDWSWHRDFGGPERRLFRSPIWGISGYMVGPASPAGEPPSLDEQVAVSLLRPRPGWLGGTGAIWGGVFLGDEKARGVYVLASPVAPGTDQVGPGVGAFTDRFGIFEIKGLDPGEYTLWVYDAGFHRGREWQTPQLEVIDPESDIFDTIWSAPVVVSAGERTGPLMIPVRRPEWAE